MKADFGKRQVQKVNYIMSQSWSLEKSVITVLLLAFIVLVAYSYSRNEYFFGDEVRWADLSYSTDRSDWGEQAPRDSSFWIKGDLWIADSTHDYNGLFLGIEGDYKVYWDGEYVGKNGGEKGSGKINFYQALDSSRLGIGSHVVEVELNTSRLLYNNKVYAGIILGNLRKFTFEPLIQFSCIAVMIGLLLVIWATLYNKRWPTATLWLIGSIVLYLILNFTKTIYNYPTYLHGYRLLAYGFSTVLLAVTLINYSLDQIGWKKYQWAIIPVSGLLALIFLIGSYDQSRWYILIISQVVSMTILLADIKQFKKALLIVVHFYLVVVMQFEVGLLMIMGYVLIVLIDYLESTLPEQVELKIKEPPVHLMASFGGDKKIVMLSEVVAIKGANNYSELILVNQERYLYDKPLGKLMEEVPEHFVRIHKSYIVDLRRVDLIRTNRAGGKMLTLNNQIEIPVGRTYKYDVLDQFR